MAGDLKALYYGINKLIQKALYPIGPLLIPLNSILNLSRRALITILFIRFGDLKYSTNRVPKSGQALQNSQNL
jgi:hypothetical protein